MSEKLSGSEEHDEKPRIMGGKSVSRREFLKLAGIAGATVGVGAGLGGLVAACGGGETTTTTTTAAATNTSAAAESSTTTVSAKPEQGREIKIGDVVAQTGAAAVFGGTEKWSVDLVTKTLGDGIVLGDGKLHKVTIIQRDSQSDSNRAGQVAGDLITSDKVDFLVASGGANNVLPAATQAETLGCPFTSNFCTIGSFLVNGALPAFKMVYRSFFDVAAEPRVEMMAFDKMGTNKKVGFIFANDIDGNLWNGILPPAYEKAGYQGTQTSQYQPPAEDFTAEISAFKKAGVEIVVGTFNPGDLANFWKQALQQDLRPKAIYVGRTFINMSVPTSIGPTSVGMMASCAFHRSFPFTDALTGMTATQLCEDYEKTTGQEWAQTIGCHAKLTWAIDVLKRAKNLDDKETIVDALRTTKMELLTGPIDMTAPVDPAGRHVSPTIYKQGWASLQVVKGADTKPTPSKWPLDQNVVGTSDYPTVEVVDPIPQVYA